MRIINVPVGMIGTNCYLLISEEKRCAVIDPGDEPERIAAAIEKDGLTPWAVLLTHGHFDHIGGAEALRRRYRIPVYLHPADWEMAGDPGKNSSKAFSLPPVVLTPDKEYREGDVLSLDELTIRVMETPGHTPGGVSLYLPGEKVLFSGDTMFRDGYGRYDLYGGDLEALVHSLEKIKALPEECRVLPGHGGETTVLREKGGF